MKVVDKSLQESPFGKHQKLLSTIFITIAYSMLYIGVGSMLYGIFTINFNIFGVLALITLLQLPIKRNQKYIDFVNKYIHPLKFFQGFRITYDSEIPKDKKCIFGFHPHSVYSAGLLGAINSQKTGCFSNIVGLGSRFILNYPLAGAVLKLWGIQPVNAANMRKLMKAQKNIALVPGGFEQATMTSANQLRVWISNRKGFIKYAIQYGYTVYPVLVLNQHQAFWTFQPLISFRLLLNRLKMPGVFFWSKKTGPFLPPTVKFEVIVGNGLLINNGERVENPSQEEIESIHQRYIDQILRLYQKYKHLNGGKPLRII